MSLFRRAKTDEAMEEPRPLEPTYTFEPKPQDLLEWSRPERIPTLDPRPTVLPWSKESPTAVGLYWWKPRDYVGDLSPLLAVVLDFGGRLCVRKSRGDSSQFISITMLERQWAGPITLAEGMDVERLEVE